MALTMSMFNPSPILKNPKLANPTTPISPADPLSTKPDPKLSSSLSATWRTIQGSDNWQHLVDPLDPLLRSELIRYGQLASACYKAFDLDPSSKRYLNCKHGKKSLFKSVGMENTGYNITKYIYATPDITIPTQPATCCSRWIGYIAISSNEEVYRLGRRDIVVSFRGTVTSTEWIANLMSSLTPARLNPNNPQCEVKVESGFLSLYTSDDSTSKFSQGSCREQLLSEVSRIVHEYRDEEMSITLVGHSMGSSLAILLGYDLAELGLNRDASKREIPITVFSFGGPRVGNLVFKRRCEELRVKVLRVVNANDPVTKMPGVVLNEWCRIWGERYCYAHVGVELGLDFFKMGDPIWVHDLNAYLLGLNNYCGCDNKVVEVKKKKEEEEDINVMGKARDNQLNNNIINVSSKHKHGKRIWPWKFAARQVGDLVQSLGF